MKPSPFPGTFTKMIPSQANHSSQRGGIKILPKAHLRFKEKGRQESIFALKQEDKRLILAEALLCQETILIL